MAAPSYTTDLQVYNDATSVTGFAEATNMTTTDGSGVLDGDLAIYGTTCISESQRKSGLGSLVYTGTAPTWTSGWGYFIWFKFFAPNSLGTKTNGGIRTLVGSSAANYRGWYVDGSDTYAYGGWKNYVVDPQQTGLASQTQGTPTTTYNTVGIGVNQINGISKGNAFTIDIIRYGRGAARFTNGDLANGYATFAGFAAVNDNATTGRWGLIQEIKGGYLWKGLMSLGLSGTAVDMRDSNVVITIDNTEMVASSFNRIEVNNASSNVLWTSVLISSLSTQSRGQFEMINNATVTFDGCVFTDMDTFIFQSNATNTDCTYRRCNQITQGGSTFDGCLITNSTSAVSVLSNNPSLISDSEFRSDGSNHAVQFTTAGSYSWTNNVVTGYATTNGTTGNEVFYNNTNGQVTINVSGGSGVLSVRNGGTSTTTINSTVSVTVTGLKDNTEVRVLEFGTNTELAGIENATSGTTNNRSFTFSLSAATETTIKIHNVTYEHVSIDYTVPGSAASIPVQQRFDRNYLNP